MRSARQRFRLLHGMIAVSLLLPRLGAADPADDRFDSENKAQSVRPPVLALGESAKLPYTMTRADLSGQKTVSADSLRELTGLEGKDVLVTGTVASVYIPKGGTKLILNLGRDYRKCFKVVVDIRDFPRWGSKKAEDIGKMYDKKTVAVGGIISMYQGSPQILASLPSQITVITPSR
jgi:hypothetical protein